MSDTNTTATPTVTEPATVALAKPAKPTIFDEAENFLNSIPQRKSELQNLRVKERLADQALFEARRVLALATEAVTLAGPDDPQRSEHEHFQSQAAEAVTRAHNALQQARLAVVTAETVLNKDPAAAELAPRLRQAVGEHQSQAIEKFLRDFASSGFQRTLQRGHALADALGIRLDQAPPANAPSAVKALVTTLTVMPDASGWADNPQAQTLFDANKSPSLMLTNLEQHNAAAARWLAARYKPSNNIQGGFDSAGVYRVLQSGGCTFRGQEYPRGSFVTLSAIDPTGGKDAVASLKRLVTNGSIQMVSGDVQPQQQPPTAAATA